MPKKIQREDYVLEEYLTPRQKRALSSLEKAVIKLRGLNTKSLETIHACLASSGTSDSDPDTERLCQSFIEQIVDEKS
jgi:hypothetical protein